MADAFSLIRSLIGSPRQARLSTQRFDDELIQMESCDGLLKIIEHKSNNLNYSVIYPDVTDDIIKNTYLWVVRENDAVHAAENCDFGQRLGNGRIKHTNLTGGHPAFCAGELLWADNRRVLISGCSGRYGPRNSTELQSAAVAFTNAGYSVWSTGYDEGTGFCFKFGASIPIEVVAL